MNSRCNKHATPSSSKDGVSKKRCTQRWGDIKLDVHRIYMEEGKTLEQTMDAIQIIHDFQRSTGSWKNKMNKWGFTKYKRRRNRRCTVARGGREMTVPLEIVRSTAQEVETFKKRRIQQLDVPLSIPIAPHLLYDTPAGFNTEKVFGEESYQESLRPQSPLFQASRSSIDRSSPALLPYSAVRGPLGTNFDFTGVFHITALDRFLCDKIQPWSEYALSHQLGDQDTALANHRKLLAQVAYLDEVFDERIAPPESPGDQNRSPRPSQIGDEFFGDCFAAAQDYQSDRASEPSDLGDLLELFDLAAKLAADQNEHGEFATPTLKQEFDLAKADERNGNLEEAEYHCRRILDKDPHVNVQAYLGMILAHTSRLEESTFWLFAALTGFIIGFGSPLAEINARKFPLIENLFVEVNHKTMNEDWAALTLCMCQMMRLIQTALSEDTLDQIFPQLLIHGFCLAQECLALGHIDSAKYMYGALLQCSSQLNANLCRIDKAKAHYQYGLLLRLQGEYGSSAKQLRLACEFARLSAIQDGFITRLKKDCLEILPCLSVQSVEEVLLRQAIAKLFDCRQGQDSPKVHTTLLSRIDDYLSSDLPVSLFNLEPSVVSYNAQFKLLSIAGESSPNDGQTSTMSASLSGYVSHKYGSTWSDSEITGISHSAWMFP